MLFSRGAKELGPSNFNPPPGYYHSGQETLAVRKNVSFPRGPRFQAELITETPGPGTYSSQEKEMTRKRTQHLK